MREFAEYFHQSPDKLGPEHIRQYQAHLFQTKKLAPATVSQYVSALRFLFVKTLRRHFLAEHILFPKSRKQLATVLSPEEVAQLIQAKRIAPRVRHASGFVQIPLSQVPRQETLSLCAEPSPPAHLSIGY